MVGLSLIEATFDDLPRIMAMEAQGFVDGLREGVEVYARRIAVFPTGALLAYRGDEPVGCVFCEIWRPASAWQAEHFALGHDIEARHDPVAGTELYISSMTVAPTCRGEGLGAWLLRGCLAQVRAACPQLRTALLLVNEHWTQARRIYAAEGFVTEGRLEGFFQPAEGPAQAGLVMRRAW